MAIALSVCLEKVREFSVTTMDYLIALVVLGISVLAKGKIVGTGMMAIALKVIIMFYGCDVILTRMETRWNLFTLSVLASLLIISICGVMSNIL